MRAQVHVRAATLRASTARFLSGSSNPAAADCGGGVRRRFAAPARPRRRSGGNHWQWQTTRARLDVAVRPETYREELDAKIERARAHFAASSSSSSDVGNTREVPLPETEVFESARSHFRMRAEFRVWHEGEKSFLAMFDSDDPKTPVEVPQFPMGSEKINELMPKLLAEIEASETLRKKLFQVNFLTTVKGEAMISMLYHRRLTEEWEAQAEAMRHRLGVSIVGRSRKQKVILGVDFVREELVVDGTPLQYKQLEGGFTQPNAGISVLMLQWAKNAAVYDESESTNPSQTHHERRDDDFLELYCGNGNFTVAMAPMFRRVLATEVSKVSVAAAKENLVANGVTNVDVVRLSSEELTRAMDEGKTFERLNGVDLSEFDLKTVLVDPPRAGMGPEVTKFVSRFGRIVYISCNPKTLAEDVRALAETHEVRRFATFDQFPYTPHLECGALLVAKDGSSGS